MGVSSIQHNMLMVNADRRMRENAKIKKNATEKLTSGYRINRAADDAAGLSMSEKMRFMIRGLNQGTENAMDGISWVQIGDGALVEAHDMIHRMSELAIKASNGTSTDDDREMMQAEFENLRREIDRLTYNTTFNEQHVFQSHDWPYHQIEGSAYWPTIEEHTVREGENDLVVTYAMKEGDPLETVSVKVAAGTYTTKELVDEIDTALEEAGLLDKGIYIQYTDTGFCNLNLEDGQVIDEVSGGLSYLLYDNFNGGTLGALIGTTVFPDDNTKVLLVESGQNGHMTFQLLDPEDPTKKTPITIDLADGMYSKKELIDQLNTTMEQALTNSGKSGKVEATSEGNIIKISSPDYIVSEFQGNMFTIDGGIYSSVFYDNIKYADRIDRFPAQLQGGYVVWDAAYNQTADPEGSVFHFSAGDRLVMNPNGRGELVIDMEPMNHKTIDEVITYLQQKFDDFEYTDEEGNLQKGAGLSVSKRTQLNYIYNNKEHGTSSYDRVYSAALRIVSQVSGPDSTLGIDKTKSTAYAPLFTSRRVTGYQWHADFGENDTTADTNDFLLGLRTLGGMTIEDGKNDAFEIRLSSGDWKTIKLDAGTYANAGALAAEIQKQADAVYGAGTLKITATTATGDVPSNRIRIEAASSDVKGIEVGAHQETDGTTNIGYREIFQGKLDNPVTESAPAANKATILLPEIKTLDADGKITISPAEGNFAVTVNGKERSVNLAGTWTLAELEKKIEDAFPKTDEPYKFKDINAAGSTTTRKATATSNSGGKTQSNAGNYSNYSKTKGNTVPNEGDPSRPTSNTGAKITFASALPSSVKITDANKDFTFILNGDTHTIDLTTLGNSDHTYTRDDFKNKLQAAITKKLGNKGPDQYGGLKVDLSGNGVLSLTAGLNLDGGGQYVGEKTTLEMEVNQKGGFVYHLHDASTPATATLGATQTSDAPGAGGDSVIYANSSFTGSGKVRLKLTKPGGATETMDVSVSGASSYTDLQSKLNTWFTNNSKNITASVNAYGVTFSTTGDWKADGYKLEIDAANSDLQNKLFGYADDNYKMEKKTGATASTDIAMTSEKLIKFDADQSFEMTVDNTKQPVKIRKNTAGYSWDGMVTELQRALDEAFGKNKVTVKRSGNSQYPGVLTFSTVSQNGKSSTIVLPYQEKNGANPSALRTIFGAREIGGVDASFEHVKDGSGNPDPNKVQLRLTRIPYDAADPNDAGSISVTSNTLYAPDKYGDRYSTYKGGSFIRPDTTYSSPKAAAGYHSKDNSYMQGVQLMPTNGTVEIDEFNKHLSFYYSENYGNAGNVPQHIEFDLEEQKYTPDQLVNALQEKIDDIIGAGKLKVLIEKGGIRIETAAQNSGSKYRIHTNWTSEPANLRPSGSFYEKILSGNRLSKAYTRPPIDEEGKQTGGRVYAMGRQDVKNGTTKIQRDGNDTLSLRFTTPDAPNGITLEMVLDPGYYSGDELTAQIQSKLDQALEKAGLKKGLIEAVIGYEDPDSEKVVGAINDRALAFKLSDSVTVPKDGKYVIDTIGGTAAFSVFYATDGDIARAYVRGGKDITDGVEIKEGQNTLSVEVDDKPYEIELNAGQYTAPDLIDHINDKLKDGAVPLKAYIDEGRLKIMHAKYGQHTIRHLGGGVKNQLIFGEKGVLDDDQPMRLKVSGAEGDYIEMEKPWMDTSALGINTLTVEKYKNAQKAIKRLKSALTEVSRVRSYFGAMQNRLESTVRNNLNKLENTTAAESRIRDADFSKEAVNLSIHNILEQSGVSMMTQVMQNSKFALQLLS